MALVAVLVLLVAPAPSARADGDPASDILLSQTMFVPSDADTSAAQQAQLGTLLRSAQRDGSPIRVAVIPTEYDLGSVGILWRRPRVYARFLGIELSSVYRGALLVVMPNGFGVNLPGSPTAAAYARLARISIGPAGGSLLGATDAAVRALASVEHVTLATPAAGRPSNGDGAPALAVGVLAAAAGLLAGIVVLRRRARLVASRAAAVGRRLAGALPRPRSRLATLNVALGVAAAAMALVLGLKLARGTTSAPASGAAQQASDADAPLIFPPRERAASDFRLRDQDGRPVSLAGFRGKPVIVTFIDPLCRNLCPLAAHVLNQMDRELPSAERVPIIAVSIDIYADSRADLLEDYDRWGLVPQWHWAIGTPARLAAVWRDYAVQVEVQTKHIAGVTVHFITHDEIAYVVDPDGYTRALFTWPYSVQGLEHTLEHVAQS